MRLVAFDIESPNGMFLEGNICEFGYVMTDDGFHIVESDNILIKPIVATTNRLSRIKLAYTMREYMSSPTFIDTFPKIERVLSIPQSLIVGHAIHNDILCMISACKVHGLKLPDFTFIDSQIVFSIFRDEKMVCGLDKIAKDLNLDFRHHKADEDARLALLTLLRICEEKECSLDELITSYDIQCGKVESGYVINCRTPQFTSAAPSVNSRNSKKKLLNYYLNNSKPGIIDMQKKHELYNKKIVLDLDIEYEDVSLTRRIIQRAADIGAKYLRYGNSYDIFVTKNEDMLNKHPKNCIKLEQLMEMMGELPNIIFDDADILDTIREERSRVRQEERHNNKEVVDKKMVISHNACGKV